jgi:hypothetical protein
MCWPPRPRTGGSDWQPSLVSPAYASTAERVQAFVAQGGGCGAAPFIYRRKLSGGKAKALEGGNS